MEVARRLFGATHPDTLDSIGKLAELLIAVGRFEQAEPLALECEAGNREQHGADAPETARATELLIDVYEGWHGAEPDAGHDASAAVWRDTLTGGAGAD